MTYRGIYRDGIVTLIGDVDLRNGAAVDVNLRAGSKSSSERSPSGPSKKTRKRASTKTKKSSLSSLWNSIQKTKMTRAQRIAAVMQACGTWKDRPEWKGKSSAQISLELREQASRRGRNG